MKGLIIVQLRVVVNDDTVRSSYGMHTKTNGKILEEGNMISALFIYLEQGAHTAFYFLEQITSKACMSII
jgi:hypothetical protein